MQSYSLWLCDSIPHRHLKFLVASKGVFVSLWQSVLLTQQIHMRGCACAGFRLIFASTAVAKLIHSPVILYVNTDIQQLASHYLILASL